MNGLLTAATVIRGDGTWSATEYGVDTLSCGRTFYTTDLCDVDPADLPDVPDRGYLVRPFAILADQKFPVRCSPATVQDELGIAMENATEYQVAKVFWEGAVANWDGEIFMGNTDVETVTRGANVQETMAAVLSRAFEKHPELDPVVHLGFLSAMQLGPSKLDDLDIDYCISPGYPTDAIAVTGPVVVHLGSIETLDAYDTSDNRKYITASRMAAVEFDPCLAIRAV